MAKKSKGKRKRSTSEMIMIVLGILIALSMILSLIVGLGSSRSTRAPLPPDAFPAELGIPVGALQAAVAVIALVSAVGAGPPIF